MRSWRRVDPATSQTKQNLGRGTSGWTYMVCLRFSVAASASSRFAPHAEWTKFAKIGASDVSHAGNWLVATCYYFLLLPPVAFDEAFAPCFCGVWCSASCTKSDQSTRGRKRWRKLRRRSLDTGTSSAQGVTSLERMMKLLMLHLFWTLGVWIEVKTFHAAVACRFSRTISNMSAETWFELLQQGFGPFWREGCEMPLRRFQFNHGFGEKRNCEVWNCQRALRLSSCVTDQACHSMSSSCLSMAWLMACGSIPEHNVMPRLQDLQDSVLVDSVVYAWHRLCDDMRWCWCQGAQDAVQTSPGDIDPNDEGSVPGSCGQVAPLVHPGSGRETCLQDGADQNTWGSTMEFIA